MRCRPSEVRAEDENDVALWILWDKVEALVSARKHKAAESK